MNRRAVTGAAIIVAWVAGIGMLVRREYFRPQREREIEKDRRRWLVGYRGVQFYVHLDRLLKPATDGYFLEVKSRTSKNGWSPTVEFRPK